MLERPKGFDYYYIGEDEQWHIHEDAPDWAKKEFAEFQQKVNPKPDESGIITAY